MGFLSRVTGFDQSRGAFNAVLASYIFEAIDIHKKKRVADEVLQIVGSVWKHYDRAEIARKLNNEIRVVQCNFLALAFDNLGVEAPGRNAWWRVNNPFVLTSQITDTTLRHAAEVVSRDDGFAVSWPGNAARIDFVTVCGIGPKPSSPAPAPLTMTRKPLVTSHTSSDEVHWARALEEFEGANRRRGLWAKSFAEADGDEVKAKVFYLKARVLQLEQEQLTDVTQTGCVKPEGGTLEPTHKRSFLEEEQERMRILAQAQQERDSQPKGRCPNSSCNALVPISAQGCAACGALFDVGAAWKPIPLT